MPRLLPERFSAVASVQGPIAVPRRLRALALEGTVLFPRVPVSVAVLPSAWEMLGPALDDEAVVGFLSRGDVAAPRVNGRLSPLGFLFVAETSPVLSFAGKLTDEGCAARVIGATEVRDGFVELLVRGGPRFRVAAGQADEGLGVAVVPMPEPEPARHALAPEAEQALREVADAVLTAFLGERTSALHWLDTMRTMHDVASVCLYALELAAEDQQALLVGGPEARLARALSELVSGKHAQHRRRDALERIRATTGFPR